MTWWDEDQPTNPRRPVGPDPTLPPDPTRGLWPPAGPPTSPPPAGGWPPGPPGGGWPPVVPTPPSGPGRRNRRRRRRGTFAALTVAALLAVGAGALLAWASGGHSGIFPTTSNSSNSPANPVSHAQLNPAAIAAQTDPAIVDVTARLADGSGEAAGTGMVLTSSGEILTNNHVVENAALGGITVKISNRSDTFPAKVVGTDLVDDIAVLQAQGASGLTTIPLGNSSQVSVGDGVVAIGNAFNRAGPPTVTDGTVTALGRSITVRGDAGTEQLGNLIETNAQLEPGNSGGPLFNAAGKVVGMNTAAATGAIPESGTNDGFAIPINDVLSIVHQIEAGKSGGNVTTGPAGFLGVSVSDNNSSGFGGGGGGGGGVTVKTVNAGSPADSAGLAPGDQITAVDGQPVTSSTQLTQLISGKHPGDSVRITWVNQNGDQHSATVRLATRQSAN